MKCLTGWCRILTAIFAVIVVVSLAAAASDLIAVSYLLGLSAGNPPDASTAEAIDTRQSIIALVQMGLNMLSAVLFLIWFYRADKNLVRAGVARLKYSPLWAVGGFFVPFLNFVRPYQVMVEVWAGSTYLAEPEESRIWTEPPVTSAVGLWWTLYLAMNLLANYAGNRLGNAASLGEAINALWLQTAADLVIVPAAIVTIMLMRRVTAMQDTAVARWHPVGLPQAA